jgi:hypothetical protein
MAPVIGLFIVMLVKDLGGMLMEGTVDKIIYVPFPYIYNLDYKTIASTVGFFNVSTCDTWYMYEFDKSVSSADRDFFGYNKGTPMTNPESSGMLNANHNVLNYPCAEVQKTVPYFTEFTTQDFSEFSDMNGYIYDKMEILSNEKMTMTQKDVTTVALKDVPDGAASIREVNKKKFSYNI